MVEKEEIKQTKKEEKESDGKEYELVQVPTQHGLAVQTPDEKNISIEELSVIIVNKLIKIETMLG